MTTRVLDLSYLNNDNDLTWSEILNRIFVMLPYYGYHRNSDRECSFTCPDKRTLCIFYPGYRTVEVDWNLESVMQFKVTLSYITEGLAYCKDFLNAWYKEKEPVPCDVKNLTEETKPAAFPKYAVFEKAPAHMSVFSYQGSVKDVVDALKVYHAHTNVWTNPDNTDVVELTGLDIKKRVVSRLVTDIRTKVIITDKPDFYIPLRDYFNSRSSTHVYYELDR